jgi:putative membrane protein
MANIAKILVAIVIFLHLGFMVLEMFYWDHDIGRRVFAMTPEISVGSKILAANQGLYNGLLAAGILFAWLKSNRSMLLFLLGSVIVAGVYGGLTAKPSIFVLQALPGALAFAAVLVSGKDRPQE